MPREVGMRGTPGEQAGEARALADEVGHTSLAALLDAAVDRAEEAELLLTRYEDGAPLLAVDARRSLRLRVAFAELQRWVDELDLASSDAEVRDEASRLLAFYLHLLTHAFGRGIRAEHDRFAIRGRGPLTGAPAARLATLRNRLRASA